MNWISVREKSPNKEGRYIIYSSKQDYSEICEWVEPKGNQVGYFLAHDGCCYAQGVTHWIEIPEPQKD